MIESEQNLKAKVNEQLSWRSGWFSWAIYCHQDSGDHSSLSYTVTVIDRSVWPLRPTTLFSAHPSRSIYSLSITGNPAGLSHVNGVRHSSAKTWNFNPSPKSQFYFNRFDICGGDNVKEVTSPAKFGSSPMSDRDATWGQHIRVLCLIFFSRATAHTGESISSTIAQKTRSGVRKTLLGMRNV